MTREQEALLKKAYDSLRGAKLLAGDRLHDLRHHAHTAPCFTSPRRYCLENDFRFRSIQL
jgi:hypothetical protein